MDAHDGKPAGMTRNERIATALMLVLVLVGVWQSYGVLLEARDDLPIRVSPPFPVIQ